MPRFQVFVTEWIEQGVQYTVTAPGPEEAARRVLEMDFREGEDYEVKVIGEDCRRTILDWVWTQDLHN